MTVEGVPATRDETLISGMEVAPLIDLVRENLRLLSELVQCHEVGRQEMGAERKIVRQPADVVAYLGAEMADLAQEQLRVMLLDTKNRLLGTQLVYQGGLNSIVVRLGDCFREAVRANAAAILLIHNHPSSDPTPSAEDVRVTRDAAQAGDLLGIDVLDHIILGGQGDFVSLRQRGLYTPGAYPAIRKQQPRAACSGVVWEVRNA